MLLHSAEVKLGIKNKTPRIWLDNALKLTKSNFISGSRYVMSIENKKLILQITENGNRLVSRKIKNERTLPIIDINTVQLLDAFANTSIGGMLCVNYYTDTIIITLTPLNAAVAAREDAFYTKLSLGQSISAVSLFTGSGFLDAAIKTGFNKCGINLNTIFANEINEQYLDNGLLNNPALKQIKTSVQSSIEVLNYYDLPTADLVIAGLPCVGFSQTGKTKNKIRHEFQHNTAGHLFVFMLSAIMRVNPAMVILENVPEAMQSDTYTIIKKVLQSNGYTVQELLLDSRMFGALEQRKRMVMVAASRNVSIDILQLKEIGLPNSSVKDILDDGKLDSFNWSEMPGLKNKQERDILKGNGFRLHTVQKDENRVSTLGKGYFKNRSNESKLVHPEDSNLLRLFTASEHARIKGFAPSMVDGLSNTKAHEVLGNGVVSHGFIALGALLAAQLKNNNGIR